MIIMIIGGYNQFCYFVNFTFGVNS